MVILNIILLTIACFCGAAQAETCDVGVDGCSWTCTKAPAVPGQVQCDALPGTPQSCEIGSSQSICGTKCTCSKALTCQVGETGCSWNCKTAPKKPGQVTCLAYPATPDTCVVGSSVSACGTTCTCSQAPTCKVGETGCSWNCKTAPTKPGQATCLAYPATPDTCVIGSSVSACGTTCTCSQAPKCKVGEKGCSWTCTKAPVKPGQLTCLAIPATPETCVVGSSITSCGTTCTCSATPPRSQCSCNSNSKSNPISILTHLLSLLRIAARKPATTPAPCVQCFKYWSKEECDKLGKVHVEATCDQCSACVDPTPCVQCLKYWSKEECDEMGKVHVEATCEACSACVDPTPCVQCLKYWSKEECDEMGKVHVEATCEACSACVDATPCV